MRQADPQSAARPRPAAASKTCFSSAVVPCDPGGELRAQRAAVTAFATAVWARVDSPMAVGTFCSWPAGLAWTECASSSEAPVADSYRATRRALMAAPSKSILSPRARS